MVFLCTWDVKFPIKGVCEESRELVELLCKLKNEVLTSYMFETAFSDWNVWFFSRFCNSNIFRTHLSLIRHRLDKFNELFLFSLAPSCSISLSNQTECTQSEWTYFSFFPLIVMHFEKCTHLSHEPCLFWVLSFNWTIQDILKHWKSEFRFIHES